MKLYNVAYSGNSYKVRHLLSQLRIPCEIVIEKMFCAFHESSSCPSYHYPLECASSAQILWSNDRRCTTRGRMPYAHTSGYPLGPYFAPFAGNYPIPNLLLCDLCALCGEISFLFWLRLHRAVRFVVNI